MKKGFVVECEAFTTPIYSTWKKAQMILEFTEELGACTYPHTIREAENGN